MTSKSSNKRSQSNLWPIVDFHGSYDGLCGYCKKEKGKISIGFRGYNVSCEVYEQLLERNWRRSGSWFYKPENDRTCCKQYAIRTDVNNFAPHKSQRKVLKKMENFLSNGRLTSGASSAVHSNKAASSTKAEQQETITRTDAAGSSSGQVSNDKKRKRGMSSSLESANSQEAETKRRVEEMLNEALKYMIEQDSNLQIVTAQSGQKPVTVRITTPKQQSKHTHANYCTNIAIVLAGLVNKYNKKTEKEKQQQKIDTGKYSAKSISQKLVELLQQHFHIEDKGLIDSIAHAESGYINLTIPKPQPSSPSSPESKKKRHLKEGEELPFAKQEKEESIEQEEEEEADSPTSSSSDDSHEITFKFSKSAFDREEFNLYKKYQVEIHKDKSEELTEKRYTNFLVDSPLLYDSSAPAAVKKYFKQGYGSYHVQYRLDGKLIGVSVLDVLPTGLSSVYFFYDTTYSFLSLGVYSAIREIQLSKEIGFPYYYLGLYIHNCKKMKYKAKFTPSDLLCNTTFKWVPLEKALPKLDVQPYCAFADNAPTTSGTKKSSSSNGELLVLFQQTPLPLRKLLDTGIVQLSAEARSRSQLILESMGPQIASQVLWFLTDEDLEMTK